jgi:hypothetical protein
MARLQANIEEFKEEEEFFKSRFGDELWAKAAHLDHLVSAMKSLAKHGTLFLDRFLNARNAIQYTGIMRMEVAHAAWRLTTNFVKIVVINGIYYEPVQNYRTNLH